MKKSQIWYMDLIVALGIFLLVIVFVFKMISTDYFFSGNEINIIAADSQKITESLMTSGIPGNWTKDDVASFGITDDNYIMNLTKLLMLKNFTLANYSTSKRIMGIKSDFAIYFKDRDNNLLNFSGNVWFGKPDFSEEVINLTDPKNIITVSRYMGYNHDNITEIVAMEVVAWQE